MGGEFGLNAWECSQGLTLGDHKGDFGDSCGGGAGLQHLKAMFLKIINMPEMIKIGAF